MIPQLVVIPLLLSLVLSLAITYLTIIGYRALGLVDASTASQHPKHIHTRPVPRGGGIPIFVTMFFVALLFTRLDKQLAGILLGAIIITVAGILDDMLDVSPYVRLVIGVVAALMVVAGGTYISFVSNPLGTGVIQLNTVTAMSVVTILWIVWGMNFVNMGAKGLDGQLPGVVVIAAVVMGTLSWRFVGDPASWVSIYMAFALAGAYAGLLFFNIYPQRIMPGWGGGALAGYFLAVLSILSGAKVATALIVLGVPLMDVIYVIARRIGAGRSPVWGDTNHLHHGLLKLGWSKTQVAYFYWGVTGLLGAIALHLNSQAKIYTILLIAVAVGGVLLWINLSLSSNRSE